MLECFADLDRLDMLEALLIGWLRSPSALSLNKEVDVETPDWNDILAKTLNNSTTTVEASDDLDAFGRDDARSLRPSNGCSSLTFSSSIPLYGVVSF